ncbi:MAG: GTP 3',8-cyclase MoaA, partial [Rhodospirillales bacterium]|nr:GTP 3',8-cyclase MoaA [Rhodospirillales bacterium]
GRISEVLNGLDAAAGAGLAIKINTVALRGINETEIDSLLSWCGDRGFDMTLIETMPMGEIDADRTDHYLPLSELRSRLALNWTLTDIPEKTGGPARYVHVGEIGGKLGFITPMTHNFCEDCNRVRLTCTGQLYMCLGQDDNADLRAAVRSSESDDALNAAIDDAIARKPKSHEFVIDPSTKQPAVERHMSVTGG